MPLFEDAASVRDAIAPLPPHLPRTDVSPVGDAWHYAPEDFARGTLARLVAETFAVNRYVDFADNWGRPPAVRRFRAVLAAPTLVRVDGTATAHVDGDPAGAFGADSPLTLPPGRAVVDVRCPDGGAAALSSEPGAEWFVEDGGAWHPTDIRHGVRPPHREGETTEPVVLRMVEPGLYEAPAPLFGRPIVTLASRSDDAPRLVSGESRAEALAAHEDREGLFETTALPSDPTTFTTPHEHAIRFLSVRTASGAPVDVARALVHARVRPQPVRGAFATDDEVLNRIWSSSAYTLHATAQRLPLDGIKRDRLPWAGDHAQAAAVNAFTLADPALTRDGLDALGHPSDGYVNGIADYSLWWLITRRLERTYFGGSVSAREAERLVDFLVPLLDDVGDDGVWRPRRGAGAFEHTNEGAVFLDWGVRIEPGRDATALALLWAWATRAASELLAQADHPFAATVDDASQGAFRVAYERGWNPRERAWNAYLDGAASPGALGAPTAHANFLAVLSGAHRGLPSDEVARRILAHTGTPFMRAFALRALAALGESSTVVSRVREEWGAMLEHGAATFWEEFGVDDHTSMYGRPFGRSLAHGWAAGPAALLPEAVLGLRPAGDGWRSFTVAPALGALTWAAAVVPTPHGDIVASVSGGRMLLTVPAGTTALLPGEAVRGPARVEREL